VAERGGGRRLSSDGKSGGQRLAAGLSLDTVNER
jgi:hypothetical protein